MSQLLSGRKILLTGVSRGIGYECAKLFLKEGADLIGTGKDQNRLERVSGEFKKLGSFQSIECDLNRPGYEEKIASEVKNRWGSLDILFNNAGVMAARASLMEDSVESFREQMEVNLMAPFLLTRALVPLLMKGYEPRIINTSSGAGQMKELVNTNIAGYRLSKWSLNGLTMLLAAELSGKIAVNCFDPGWVKTDLGGNQAPGLPEESAKGALALCLEPFSETGKFWKDGKEISF